MFPLLLCSFEPWRVRKRERERAKKSERKTIHFWTYERNLSTIIVSLPRGKEH